MKRYLHVGFAFVGQPKISELVPIFNKADDWLRYAPNCWIIWTAESPEAWDARLKPLLGDKDMVLVCPINLKDHDGWLTREMWDWINRTRT